MIQSCDVGSLPYTGKPNKLSEGINHFINNLNDASAEFFEQTIVNAFLDKLKAGISVPTFPQFRDMNEMFLSAFEGLERVKNGYVETGRLALKPRQKMLPELAAIKKGAEKIQAQTDNPFQMRICVTGPYTLASFFPYRTSQTYSRLAMVLSEIVEKSVFAGKHGKVVLVSLEEPLFGLVDEPLIDRGTEGRESLLAAWESIMRKARGKNVDTCIHLHRTSDDLFWSVKSLRIVESHIDDSLYQMQNTMQHLQREDKLLNATIAITDFDRLIREKLGSKATNDSVANAWKNISKGTVNPKTFLEDVAVMNKRLVRIIERFGMEKVALAGPECGLWGFPSYACAIECLKRVARAVE